MEAVAHRDAASGVVLSKDSSHRPHTLKRGPAGGIGEDFAGRDALLDEVIPPHASLGEHWVSPPGSRGHHERREALLFEVKSMVEPGFEDGRRLAGILRRPENDDGAGGRGFVTAGLPADTAV